MSSLSGAGLTFKSFLLFSFEKRVSRRRNVSSWLIFTNPWSNRKFSDTRWWRSNRVNQHILLIYIVSCFHEIFFQVITYSVWHLVLPIIVLINTRLHKSRVFYQILHGLTFKITTVNGGNWMLDCIGAAAIRVRFL